MPHRPLAVAFDVLETLADVGSLRGRFEETGLPPELARPWFMRVQRDSMALSLSGGFADFGAMARQALHVESGQTVTDAQVDHVLEGFAELPAHPDAEPALRLLREAGVRVGCLTVGEPESTARFLAHSGLASHVEEVVTARQAAVSKPAPAVYRVAADRLRVPLDRMALVAVHAWDCHGAKRAGALAGWCERLEGRYGGLFAPPDVTGPDLVAVVDQLLRLPSPA